MKRLIALSLVTMCAISSAWASEPRPDTAATLIRLEHAWQQAILSGNKSVLRSVLAQNFLDTSYKGVLRTKQDILAGMMNTPRYNAALSDLEVRVFGDTAIVTGLNTVTGPDKAWTAKLRFTDVFINRGNRWQAIGAQESMIDITGGHPATRR